MNACDHGTCGHRAHPGAYGFGYEICELLIRGMRLFYVLFGYIAQGLRDFEWVIGHDFLPGNKVQKRSRSRGSSSMTKIKTNCLSHYVAGGS